MDKPLLRQQLRRKRNHIQGHDRHRRTRAIIHQLERLPPLRQARRIGCYFAFDGEPDLRAWMLEHLPAIWLPVINQEQQLRFRPAPPGLAQRALIPNRFGIPEPATRPTLSTTHLDAVLMPLVGFDRLGNRLGMGAGFYDRSLAGLKRPRPALIGIAFEDQRIEQLPADAWDVPLDYIVTERRIHRCYKNRARTSAPASSRRT